MTYTPYESTAPAMLTTRVSRRSLLRRSLALGLSLPAVSALLAACGGSDKATNTVSSADSVTKASGSSSPTGSGAAGSAVAGTTHTVEMLDQLKFDPAELTVKAGDTVTWKNTGSMPHTTTCDPSKALDKNHIKQPDGGDTWDSGILNGGQSYSHTFVVPGDYQYICIPHEAANMIGKVTVQP
jgi:plastocyanin